MSTLTCTFRSYCLSADTTINVILPEDVHEDIPTLYLLHGMHGNFNSWQNKTSIARYAAKYSIAVVMASAENSFYCNMKYGYPYYDFFARELIEFTRKTFNLSTKREKTFVAGLSMGGYGAIKLALRNPDLFCAGAGLSGCLNINQTVEHADFTPILKSIWGEEYKTATKDTEDDLFFLIKKFPEDKPKPRLFIACGTEDFLIEQNRLFHALLEETDFEFEYREGSGAHTWAFWDKWIVPAIKFATQKED